MGTSFRGHLSDCYSVSGGLGPSSAPGGLSLTSGSVGSCGPAFVDAMLAVASLGLLLPLPADCCLSQKLLPVMSAGKRHFSGTCLLLLYSTEPGFSRSLLMPTLGPHVPPKTTSIVRPWGAGSVLERVLSTARDLQTVLGRGTVTPGSCGDISNLLLWFLFLEEGLG